jgi:hypothetical protein
VTGPGTSGNSVSNRTRVGSQIEPDQNVPSNTAPAETESDTSDDGATHWGGPSAGASMEGHDRASSGSAGGTLR